MPISEKPIAVVTGASSGIGAATAKSLADAGYHLILGARRLDQLQQIAGPLQAEAYALDVTNQESVTEFCGHVTGVNVLVNNAGGALGMDSVAEADDEKWETMYRTNVLGVMHMTRALLPQLEASQDGHIVTVTSTAAMEVYPGGAGYTAAKHASKAVMQTLRLELLGKPIRISEVAPGMVETEFSVVRFGGDRDRADQVYAGMTPLTAKDIAEAIVWVVTRPAHVNIDTLVIRPRDQATSMQVHRQGA